MLEEKVEIGIVRVNIKEENRFFFGEDNLNEWMGRRIMPTIFSQMIIKTSVEMLTTKGCMEH